MILTYTERLDNSIIDHLQKELCDTVISLNERIAKNDTSEIFSGNAFVLLADCRRHPPLSLCKQLALTKLKGSKVLYCLFFSSYSSKYIEIITRKFTDEKGLVLFGYDNYILNANGHLCDNEQIRFNQCINMIRDYRPLAGTQDLSFPYRTQKANYCKVYKKCYN